MKFFRVVLGILLLTVAADVAYCASAAPAEIGKMHKWVRAVFAVGKKPSASAPAPPFSFTYSGQSSADLLGHWNPQQTTTTLDAQRTQTTLTWTDPQTSLSVKCVTVQYNDFPTVEWTLYFQNNGTADTPILSDIQALDTTLHRGASGEFLLHHADGSTAIPTDFQPLETTLGPSQALTLAPNGGRASNGVWPYFNVTWPDQSVIVAVGWPGQWATQFTRDTGDGLRVRAGQELTHFVLHPGEEVRTPLIALQFSQGDWVSSQNTWRRWMLAHNTPLLNGKPLAPAIFGCSSSQTNQVIDTNTAGQQEFIRDYPAHGLKIDYWWMDTGWYPMLNPGDWANSVGNWEVDTSRFPGGLSGVFDYAHARGVGGLVWFEPERVAAGTQLANAHPEWLISAPPNPGGQAFQSNWSLLNLGNPDALSWAVDHFSNLIQTQKIDVYRQDFNMDPLLYWQSQDTPDRQGITENHYITGYLAYWDGLLSRNPGLLIDNCSSGGRRLDLESLRRSVPRTRSDLEFQPEGNQDQTYALSFWLPYNGNGFMDSVSYAAAATGLVPDHNFHGDDPYLFRSEMFPAIVSCLDVRRSDLHYATLGNLFNQWRDVSPYLLGDYYPLSDYSTSSDAWMAWQFDRPELGRGMVQAFRRADSPQTITVYKLRGLTPAARYRVRNLDVPGVTQRTGQQLMQDGLTVTLTGKPTAAVIVYSKVR